MKRPAQLLLLLLYALTTVMEFRGPEIRFLSNVNFPKQPLSSNPTHHSHSHADEKADHDPLDHDHDNGKVRYSVITAPFLGVSNVNVSPSP
jgi:hypothetical protein